MFVTSIFDTSNALFSAACNLFQSTAQSGSMTPTALLIPGGNTPRRLFEQIELNPFPVADSFRIGYTDERLVPEQDPANNYALSTAMLQALDITSTQVLRVDTTLSLEDAAAAYDNAWKEFFNQGGALPLAFLGLGVDGHTCSLFTEAQLHTCTEYSFAAAVPRSDGPDRITVTPALLSRIRHVIILVTGQDKSAIVNAMSDRPETVVAGIALSRCSRVSIWYAPQD